MSDLIIHQAVQFSCNNFEENKSIKVKESNADNNIKVVDELQSVDSSSDKEKCKVLTSELTLENFKQTIVNEYKEELGKTCSFEQIDDNYLAERFNLILNSMSDEEKAAKLAFVLKEFQSKPILISKFFNSFKDKNYATKSADTIDFQTLSQLEVGAQCEVLKYMSVPGTNKLFQDYQVEVKKFYIEHAELIDRVYKNNIPDEELTQEEQVIIKEYRALIGLGVTITQSVFKNENFTEEDTKEFINKTQSFFQAIPFYEQYLEGLADFLSKNKDPLNITKDKIKELLDEGSENKFSEIIENQSKKSAFDSELSNFKIVSVEQIFQSEEKIQEIKQIIENDILQNNIDDRATEESLLAQNIDFRTLTDNYNVERIKDIFTGKVKISDFLQVVAIKHYKLMNVSTQGQMLQSATGKFFNDLIDNTKSSTLKKLLNVGWKGNSFALTKQVKDTIEERNDDVA